MERLWDGRLPGTAQLPPHGLITALPLARKRGSGGISTSLAFLLSSHLRCAADDLIPIPVLSETTAASAGIQIAEGGETKTCSFATTIFRPALLDLPLGSVIIFDGRLLHTFDDSAPSVWKDAAGDGIIRGEETKRSTSTHLRPHVLTSFVNEWFAARDINSGAMGKNERNAALSFGRQQSQSFDEHTSSFQTLFSRVDHQTYTKQLKEMIVERGAATEEYLASLESEYKYCKSLNHTRFTFTFCRCKIYTRQDFEFPLTDQISPMDSVPHCTVRTVKINMGDLKKEYFPF